MQFYVNDVNLKRDKNAVNRIRRKKPFSYHLKLALNRSLSLLVKLLSLLDLIFFFAQINCFTQLFSAVVIAFIDFIYIFFYSYGIFLHICTLTQWIHFNLFGTVIGSFRGNNSQLMFDCSCFVRNRINDARKKNVHRSILQLVPVTPIHTRTRNCHWCVFLCAIDGHEMEIRCLHAY